MVQPLYLYEELKAVVAKLNAEGIEYALCGGVALTLHGFIRATKDIDILIRLDDLIRVTKAVNSLGFILESGRIPFGHGGPDQHEIFRISKADGEDLLTLDLLIVGKVHKEVWEAREVVFWGGMELQVVSLDGLIRMKQLAGRRQDLVDIERLRAATRGEEP
ncbi:MAG: nucleotidyltransferase family protein [bacterium]|nr:nucleotidyltransferase family protein [bacterium]